MNGWTVRLGLIVRFELERKDSVWVTDRVIATISGRMPAQINGCFSMRPSCGMISTEGMWSGAP